jgi:hypothetical protein
MLEGDLFAFIGRGRTDGFDDETPDGAEVAHADRLFENRI